MNKTPNLKSSSNSNKDQSPLENTDLSTTGDTLLASAPANIWKYTWPVDENAYTEFGDKVSLL